MTWFASTTRKRTCHAIAAVSLLQFTVQSRDVDVVSITTILHFRSRFMYFVYKHKVVMIVY